MGDWPAASTPQRAHRTEVRWRSIFLQACRVYRSWSVGEAVAAPLPLSGVWQSRSPGQRRAYGGRRTS